MHDHKILRQELIILLNLMTLYDYHNNEKLDHIPSSCIVLMVHVVKVVNIHIDAGASIAEMESKMLRSTLDFEFRCFNQRR